jgi:hypothetical protein
MLSFSLFAKREGGIGHRCIALARFSAREYVEASPLAAAMSALMRRGRSSEELELRARMLRQVFGSDLDQRRKYLLVNMIETYFELSPEEEESFRRLIARKEYREVQSTKLTWGDKLILEGRERGREEGREEGIVQGKRDALKRLLTTRFGPLPKEVEASVDRASSVEELDRYLDRVLVASSLRDVF